MTSSEVAPHRDVGFVEALRLGFSNYVRFQGRSSRGAYWWWFLWMAIFSAVAAAADAALSPAGAAAAGGGPVTGIFGLVVFLPGLALAVRRLHDIGRSGWWVLLLLVPVIGILVLIYWYAQPGERAPNRFGADAEAGRG